MIILAGQCVLLFMSAIGLHSDVQCFMEFVHLEQCSKHDRTLKAIPVKMMNSSCLATFFLYTIEPFHKVLHQNKIV